MRWLERMNESLITIKYREGLLNIVAGTLLCCPQHEQLFLSDGDAAHCTEYLKYIAPQFMLKQYVDATVTAL